MINIQALRGYRKAVGIRTRAIVKQLQAEEMSQKVSPVRIEQLIKENAVLEEGMGVVDYWSKRTIAGLLLMPPTRHNFVHLNEAMRIKQKCQ
jgi:hypothetical protein